MAMVVRANKHEAASADTFRPMPRPRRCSKSASTTSSVAGASRAFDGDLVYFQGHASPGIYARAFLEGRLSETQLENFRRELHRAADSRPIRTPG